MSKLLPRTQILRGLVIYIEFITHIPRIFFFWDVTKCCFTGRYKCYGSVSLATLSFQLLYTEDVSSSYNQNNTTHTPLLIYLIFRRGYCSLNTSSNKIFANVSYDTIINNGLVTRVI